MRKRRTTSKVPAEPSNQLGVTMAIPEGQTIEVMDGAPAPAEFVRVGWDKYEHGMIGLYVSEDAIQNLTVPA
jgi:hypothetical protein